MRTPKRRLIPQALVEDISGAVDAAQKRIVTLEAQNAALVEALEKASRQTLPPTRAFGCVACRSFAMGRHNEGCYVGAALTPDATAAAQAFVERIRAEEREACAKVADEYAMNPQAGAWNEVLRKLGDAIRARGATPNEVLTDAKLVAAPKDGEA